MIEHTMNHVLLKPKGFSYQFPNMIINVFDADVLKLDGGIIELLYITVLASGHVM